MRVKLDLPLLRIHLAAEDQQMISEEAIRQFLIDSHFSPHNEWWIVEEKDLGQLDPSEVVEVERLD